jgi:hypothetical protein
MPSSPSRHRLARRGARALAGVAAVGALALAGCGGDSGGAASATTATAIATSPTTATTSAALSHAQLVARADAACRRAADAIAQVPAARSLDALADYAAQVHDVGTQLRDRLGALRPATADQASFSTYLDGVDASNEALDAMRTAAQDGDAAGVRAAAKAIDDAAVGVLATRAGLPGCAATTADEAGS